MQTGINRIDAASTTIASSNIGTDTASITQSLIDQKIGELQFKASANVVKAGDEMLGTLINIRA